MSPQNQEALTVLALDIGSVHTRALLFEVVEKSYRFIAAGVTPSTNDAPINDIIIGALEAVKQLQEITGRIFLSPQNSLISPSQAGGEGVDRLYVAYSVGRKIRVATFGLMADVSMGAQLSADELATVSALQTQMAAQGGASGTGTPAVTSTALPETGFADEYGVPGLVILAIVLIGVIFLSRKLRTALH